MLDRRKFIKTASAGAALAMLPWELSSVAFADEGKRPNVLIIGCDDLGQQVGCYGDKTVPTPNIDALAARGTRFENAYVTQPSCSPSRSSMFTGMYPHQNGQIGLAHRGFQMNQVWKTTPALLKAAGYYTAHMGKYHVEPARSRDNHSYNGAYGKTRSHGFIRRNVRDQLKRAKDRPFFLQVECADPHHPLLREVDGLPKNPVGPDDITRWSWTETRHKQTEAKLKEEIANYYNCVARVDALAGIVLDEVKKTGQLDNTLVIFWGDHGAPFPRGKTTLYEHGTRIPFIIAGPGVKQGQLRQDFVSTVDVLPTICAATGVKLDEKQRAVRPGHDLAPLLAGESPDWRQTVCTEMHFHTWWMYDPSRAIRDDRWKLIHHLHVKEGQPEYELYDLPADPDERKNLASDPAHAQTLARLQADLMKWRKATDDPFLDPALVRKLAAIPEDGQTPIMPWFRGKQKR